MAQQLGRYEVFKEIGQGGFAIVYRARDTELDRLVALKELRPVLLHDAEWVRRFHREARAIARLDHPQIVTIYDVAEIESRLFLVMRLVDGPGLDEVIKSQGGLPWSEAMDIVSAVAEGLDYAHAKGILHRDLKPSNILVDSERGPMLADFGLAKLAGDNSVSVTSGGGVVGTPHYIAPEVWEAKGTTAQSDIYALGCIVFEMITGEKLIKGETPPEIMMAHFKPLALPETWPAGIPSEVADVLQKAIANQPGSRYATAGEMAKALNSLSKKEAAPTKPQPAKKDIVSPAVKEQVVLPEPPDAPKSTFDSFKLQAEAEDDDFQEFEESAEYSDVVDRPGRMSSEKWKGFWAHLGPYMIVITMLGFINWMTGSDYPWFLWPALGWGVGLAFHLFGIGLSEIKGMSGQWHGFAGHFGSYAIIITMLIFIYLLSGSNYPWFMWPAGIWGAAVAIHLWTTLLVGGGNKQRRTTRITGQNRAERRQEKRQQRRRRREERHTSPAPAKEEVVSTVIQAHLVKARTYQQQIKAMIEATSDRHSRARLQDLAKHVNEWTETIEDLAQRVDRLQRNTVIRQDLESVPQAIEKLEAQLAIETNETTHTELERTLTNRKNQLAALEHLQNSIRRAEIKMESTLSALGTIYSQILTNQSTNHVADYSRLSADVDEEVRTLQDQLEALEEVKLGSVQ